jgi:hypothetical protein
MFHDELKERSPLMPSREMNLFKAAIHPIDFYTSWRLSGGFILVMADTFSRLGSIPRWETVDVSDATPQSHRILNVALHQEYSLGVIFIFSQGRKDLYHV